MTKRVGSFAEIKSKKSKTDDNIDALWDDDSNFVDIDECLILATQVCEQNVAHNVQQGDISILPHYSNFEQSDGNKYTSTQKNDISYNHNALFLNYGKISDIVNRETVSNGNLGIQNKGNYLNELDIQVKQLKEKFECKEGEVSILRTQLKETKINLEGEHQKREKEWTEKISNLKKEIVAVKSELEFKDLEIINLKNKIAEVCKVSDLLKNNRILKEGCLTNSSNTIWGKEYKLEPVLEIYYPLTDISISIFNPGPPENFQISFKGNQINDFLSTNDDNEFTLRCSNINEAKHFKLDCIFPDVYALVKSSSLDLNTKWCCGHIDKVIFTSKHVLSALHSYLVMQESIGPNKDARRVLSLEQKNGIDNLNLSIFTSSAWCDNEIGIRARQTVGVIGEIYPFCSYLRKSLLSGLNNEQNSDINKFDNYLNMINIVINQIGKTGKTKICTGFLCTAAILLFKMSFTKEFCKCYAISLSIARELLFSKPSDIVLRNLILFFKQASTHPIFVEQLCKMPQSNPMVSNKEDNLYFTKDSCLLHTFCILYNHNFIERKLMDIDIGLNTLQFIMNLLNCNPSWLHFQENNGCDCMCNINVLGINVMHELVKNYKNEKSRTTNEKRLEQYHEILRYCIRILHVISFKYFDMINKYSVDSQQKFIINYLHMLKDEVKFSDFEGEALRELNLQEDIHKIQIISFDNIPIWK